MAATEFAGTERFELRSRLGAGGMGVVYEALDRERDVRVALKTLRAPSADALFRLKREFRALQGLEHPNLVHLGELIEAGGQWFFTMELVDGIDLLTWVRPGAEIPSLAQTDSSFSSSSDSAPRPVTPRTTNSIGGTLDLARLRLAVGQLASGLHALHRAHKVHRDIKPSNVLVTPAGRVVLLDFGLIAEGFGDGDDGRVTGTPAYMAPEQGASQRVGPEADWYSVGVVLFEALTGRLPFDGAPLELLLEKQARPAPAARTFSPSVPEELDALCAELLRRDPKERPSGAAILARLGATVPDARPSAGELPSQVTPFIGRRHELALLAAAHKDARDHAVALYVEGESGQGKSALVRRFTDGILGEALVLTGRCYERESVPYKAIDDLVDALSRHLSSLPKLEAAMLLPPGVSLLAEVFPVLKRVGAIAEAPGDLAGGLAGGLDPLELRARVFAALRALLTRLAERRPLILVIDDLQWSDADSLWLLGEVMRPPDAPQLLLLATLRSAFEPAPGAPSGADILGSIEGDVRRIALGNLPPDDARALAAQLLGARNDDESALAIADEAGGHPFFIDELVRRAERNHDQAVPTLKLEDALWARILGLEPRARRLLELCAVAGAPLPSGAAARALDDPDPTVLDRASSLLRAARLARASGARGGDTLEPYHDRIRSAVLTRLLPDARRACHRRLAPALEASPTTDPAELALHWREAGDDDKAGRWAALAADRAQSALAFDRAARYYRLSLRLRPVEGTEALELRTRLGDALASAGRGVAAANAYLAAARDGDPAQALELERRAAEQLLRSGHVDDGLRALRAVMAAVGLHLPATPRRALASLLFRRARLRLRGLEFRSRDASEVKSEELTRIDVCWSVAAGLAMVDTIRGSDFQTLHLQLALEAGEPHRIARALAMEAALTAADGGPAIRRAERLVSACDALVERLNDPLVEGEAMLSAGICAFLRGSWRRTHELSTRAEALLRERCTGADWERASAEIFTLWSAAYLGELGELVTRVPVLLRQAEERGDLYAATGRSSGLANLAWLASDDLAQARARVEEAERRWSRASFQFQHYWNLLAHAQIDLYSGSGGRALERLDAEWRPLSKSLYLRIQNVRIEALHLRARARLAAACDRQPKDRDRLLSAASSDARRIARERMPWSDPLARLLEAGVASARGDRERALALFATAKSGFEAAEMKLFARAAQRRRGELLGAEEGAAEVQAADDWMRAEQIRAPEKMVAMLAPGFQGSDV